MKPFLALVRKDLKLFFSDRRSVMFTIAVPIMIASFFGSVMNGSGGKTKTSGVAIQVVDLDQSELSREIVTNLVADETLKVTLNNEATARELVRTGKAPIAVIIPKDFGEAASRTFFGPGKKPEITIAHDPSRSMEVNMVKGILTQHIMETVSKQVFGGTSGQKYVRESLDTLKLATNLDAGDASLLRDMLGSVEKWMGRTAASTNAALKESGGGLKMPFTTREEALTNDSKVEYNGYAHSFGGMGVQFILMAAIELGVGILLERQRGLWKRLRSAPLSRGVLLGAKATSTTLISAFTLGVCFAFAWLVFDVKVQGSFIGFVLCIVAFSLFAASVGLLLASFGATPGATRGLAIPVVLILLMLGGAWMPTFIFPPWLQTATLITPTRWAVDSLDAMTWRGLGFEAALAPIAVLLAYAAVCGWIAVKRFKWEAD